MTVAEFRKRVRAEFPHVKVSVRTVGFHDLARCSAKCLTIKGDRKGEAGVINGYARRAGVVPDGNVRCL